MKASRAVFGLLGAALLLMSQLATAQSGDGAAAQLLAALNQSSSLQGSFSQLQYDATGELQAESSGLFKMLRPGYFSWEIQSPDSQLILATPQYIWHLDQDLETLTRRPVNENAEISPLQILGGREDLLDSGFDIKKNTDTSYTITPRKNASGNASAGFSSLTVQLDKEVISGMDIIDALNQRVVISFHNVDKATSLSAEDFAFTPPEGVDLFYYDE